ncbi:hypothetical protein MMC24_005061 [Lignoscripta atroalba]|nr:hypothetical protein [Lignoscripta atroalba]
MAPHKRGPWSQHEDQWLLQLVQSQGAHNWVRISHIIATRSPKQCRERFHQNLKPSLNHEPITPEEGIIIERLVGEMGKRWAEIARRLRGRSDNAVKNWWNGGMNRRRRLVGRREGSNRAGDCFNERMEQLSFARPIPTVDCPVRNLFLPSSRINIEPPLASPVTSEGSTPDSVGEAPSLVSDHGSNVSTSPNVAESPSIELPSLAQHHPERRRPSLPKLQLNENASSSNPPVIPSSAREHQRPLATPKQNLYHLAELATSTSPSECYVRSPQQQVQLPSFQSLTCASQLVASRDTRMNLSNLLS